MKWESIKCENINASLELKPMPKWFDWFGIQLLLGNFIGFLCYSIPFYKNKYVYSSKLSNSDMIKILYT